MTEQWCQVPGFESFYEVSDAGRIKSLRSGLILKADPSHGYSRVKFSVDGIVTRVLVHLIVAAVFIGPCPDGREVNHKNGNGHDNRSDNLEYLTRSENHKHAFRELNRWRPTGSKHGCHKLVESDVIAIKSAFAAGARGCDIARQFNVCDGTVSLILKGKTWKHVH